jgi:membrane-associated protease RseP (regulator of RpoE activity)
MKLKLIGEIKMSNRGAILLAVGMLILGLLIGGLTGGVTGFVLGQGSRTAMAAQFLQRQQNLPSTQPQQPNQPANPTPQPGQTNPLGRRSNGNGFPPAADVINGVRVDQVDANGPAGKAGVQANDIITAIGSTKLDANHSLGDLIQAQKPGDNVTLSITRGSQTMQITVQLGASSTDSTKPLLGITYSALPGGRFRFPTQ